MLTLGLEREKWKTEAWNDPPMALKLNAPSRKNKANILLSREAVETKLDRVFKYAKSNMDGVHLWMKIGTGFQPNDLWLRIEFARPPGGFLEKTRGQNWYITRGDPVVGSEVAEAENIKFITLMDVLNAIDDVGIPARREEDGKVPYALIPGWLPQKYWNCYTALNELNDRLGIVDNVGHPFLYHLIGVFTAGAAQGRRHGDDILTERAKMVKGALPPSEAPREQRKKYNRDCGFTDICNFFNLDVRPDDKRVSTSKNHSVVSFNVFLFILFCVLVAVFLDHKNKQQHDYSREALLHIEEL